jgi:hypothetical protein
VGVALVGGFFDRDVSVSVLAHDGAVVEFGDGA